MFDGRGAAWCTGPGPAYLSRSDNGSVTTRRAHPNAGDSAVIIDVAAEAELRPAIALVPVAVALIAVAVALIAVTIALVAVAIATTAAAQEPSDAKPV